MSRFRLESIVAEDKVTQAIACLSLCGQVLCRPAELGEKLTEVDHKEPIAMLLWWPESGLDITVITKLHPGQEYDAPMFADGRVEFKGKMYDSPQHWERQMREWYEEEKRAGGYPPYEKPVEQYLEEEEIGDDIADLIDGDIEDEDVELAEAA